jgi:hypothetical protein
MATLQMTALRRHVDPASLVVIALTLVLFLAALVVKGLGHDLLLEAGVFLVSVKLIIMAYKGSVANQRLVEDLAAVRSSVQRLEKQLTSAQLSRTTEVQDTAVAGPSRGDGQ